MNRRPTGQIPLAVLVAMVLQGSFLALPAILRPFHGNLPAPILLHAASNRFAVLIALAGTWSVGAVTDSVDRRARGSPPSAA